MRITRNQMFLEIAQAVAKRGTCFREAVGAVIVKEGRVISIGYNGPAAGEEPCTIHPNGQCDRAIHAEVNAIKFMKGKHTNNYDLYVTHLPCIQCTRAIIDSGLFSRVFFNIIYGPIEATEELFNDAAIKLYRVLASGVITTPDRKSIIKDVE